MLLTLSTLALSLLSPAVLPQQGPAQERSTTPPSTVLIPGGSTLIGSTQDEILELLKEAPSHQVRVRSFDAETPQYKENVPDFYLMVSEVTNEQYLAFVEATGAPPPLLWADQQALEAARLEHAQLQQARVEEAKKNNTKPPEREPFDEAGWWERSWKETPMSVPEKLLTAPVVYVSYADAMAYAHWAGLRLQTEFEFQRAVRGSTKNPYPWGEKWNKDSSTPVAALAGARGLNAPVAAGSFPAGNSKEGLVDLIGNAWEWTSSPYVAYKGFKNNEYKVGKGKEELLKPVADWDPARQVVVGGSFGDDQYIGRGTVRRRTYRDEKTLGLGFRAAATPRPVFDRAEYLIKHEIMRSEARPEGIGYAAVSSVGIDCWLMSASKAPVKPAGYAIPRGYQFILFTPVEKLGESQDESFIRDSLLVPHPLGFLSSSESILEPALPAGTHFVAYRGAGKPPRIDPKPEEDGGDPKDKGKLESFKQRASQDPAHPAQATPANPYPEWFSKINLEVANFIFFDAVTGAFAGAIPAELCKFDKSAGPGSMNFIDHTIWETVTDAKGKEERVQKVEKRLMLDASIESPVRGRVLHLQLTLKTAPELATYSWRR